VAKKQIIQYVDDLSGEESGDIATIQFAVDGSIFEIDLTAANAEKLRADLEPYIRVARKVRGRRTQTASSNGSDASKIREWAQAQGISVPARGRIPKDVSDRYRAAN